MHFRCYLLSISCFFISSALCAANTPTQTLLARTLSPTPIIDDLHALTKTIGGRPTGSPAMDKAVDWSVSRFTQAELENVHTETYSPERNWLPQIETALYTVGSTQEKPLRVAAMPFSPSTSEQGLLAEVYAIGSGDQAAFTAAGKKLKGKWLLVTPPLMKTVEDLLNEYTITPPIFARAKKAGAAGILWVSNRPGQLLYRHNITFNGSMSALPAAVIERQGGEAMISQLKKRKTVKVKLTLRPEIQIKPMNRNVIAEIKGTTMSDEVIILGAHLDSWDLGEGALDNGCNATLVMDVARQMMTLAKEGQRPQRTVRFMLYSGEELGLYGSHFDTINHAPELDKIKAAIFYDIGTGQTTGYTLSGRHDMAAAVEKALKPVAAFGPFTQTFDASIDTDNFDYVLQGIPTLVANQNPQPYLAPYHADSDTFDKVDQRELKFNTAIAAVLLWNLANEQTLAPRQNRKEVTALLQSTGVDKEMKNFNIWDDFITGRRGISSDK